MPAATLFSAAVGHPYLALRLAQKCAQTCDACGAAAMTPPAATAACADLKRAICAKRKREGRLTCRRAAERRKCAESCGECRV